MADHNLPTLTSTYTNFVSELDGRLDDIARLLASDTVTATNLPTGAIRWNAASNTFQKWSGSAWVALTSSYSININGTVGATTAAAGAFTTLTTSGVASLAANSTVDGKIIATLDASQTLANKTLDSPTIDDIVVTGGTLQLPTGPDTLVGAAAQQTLTNKTLTAPKFADGGFIADPNGNEILEFDSVGGAVNHIAVLNSTTGNAPAIMAYGTNTNINLNLRSKGSSGVVQINGVTAVDVSTTQTLSNKTYSGTWNGNVISNTYGGTGNSANFTTGGVTYASATTILSTTGAGTSGQLLQSNGSGAPTWVNASSLTVGTANNANAVTNGVYTTGNQTIGGIKTFSSTISGSVDGNAKNLSTTRDNWSTNGTISAVVGQLAWKNYGNGHTIIDASAGTSPSGSSINQTNAANAWASSYPTLMGWNGTSTYGVRVDSARVADNGGVTSVNGQTGAVTVSTSTNAGEIGTYAYAGCWSANTGTNYFGTTRAGSNLYPAGTWKGSSGGTNNAPSDNNGDAWQASQAGLSPWPGPTGTDEWGYPVYGPYTSAAFSGTWRCMGWTGQASWALTLWVRIA